MAINSGQVAVSTSAITIVPAKSTRSEVLGGHELPNRDVYLSNSSGAIVFLGDSTVTTSTGAPLAASATLRISIHLDEAIYGIVTSTGSTVSFLASGS